MQNQTETVGGGAATGFGEDFIGFLQNALFGNSAGQAQAGTNQFQELFNKLLGSNVPQDASSRILSGVGQVGLDKGSDIGMQIQKIMDERRTEGRADLRERFGSVDPGGTSAAFAEGRFLADEAPRSSLALSEIDRAYREQDFAALGNLFNTGSQQQTQTLLGLLGIGGDLTRIGTPQAETLSLGSPLGNFFTGLTGLAEGASALGGSFKNPFAPKKG